MESLLSLLCMHWDHEPTPSPSKEGSRTAWPVPLLGGVRGGLIADTDRFMESLDSLKMLTRRCRFFRGYCEVVLKASHCAP